MSRLRTLCLSLAAALVGVALIAAPAHAADVTVSGVVRDPSGAPIADMYVSLHDELNGGQSVASGFTGPDGSYSLSAPQGSQAALTASETLVRNSFNAGTAEFGLTSDRQLDFTFPALGTLRASVVGSDGVTPVAGANVNPVLTGATGTSNGVTVYYGIAGNGCSTGNDGSCEGVVFLGGSIDHVDVTSASQTTQTFAGFATPTATTAHTFVLAAGYPVSGVLTRADGTPIADAGVALQNGSATVASTVTAADGSWSVRTQSGGPYQVRVTTTVKTSGWTLPYEIDTAPFQLDAARTIDLTLAALDTVTVNVRSSNGVAVDHPWVQVMGDLSTKAGSTPDGLAVTSYLNRNGTGAVVQCYPPYDGPCVLPVLSGGSTGRLQVAPPIPAQYFPPTSTVPGQPRVVQLIDYAIATSAGSQPGTVVASVDHGDVPELDTSAITLPDGLDPVVGRIDYRATLAPGASSALFTVSTPGTGANALFRENPDGGLVLLLTGGGQSTAFNVADGSAADADGVVNGSVSGNVIPVAMAPLRITTTDLPSAAPQKPYSVRLQGNGPGAPMIWSADQNFPLPNGLSISQDGVLSGIAPALGTYTFRVLMKDSRGWQGPATQQLTLHVDKVAVLTSSLPDGYIGGAYSSTLTFASGSLPSWAVASGALPPGLKLGASNGTISGTPTTAGTYTFDVVVKANGITSQRRTLSITVHPMEIATTSLPVAPVGASYSTKLNANGGKGTLSWSLAGGSLPPGLTLSPSGTLSGRPTTVGSYPITVRVADASTPQQVATRALVIVVSPLAVATSSLPAAKKGQYYSAQLVASGGKPTLAWTLASGVLPPGLSMSSSGKITGYPKSLGTWSFTVRVTDASTPKNTATASLTLTVN